MLFGMHLSSMQLSHLQGLLLAYFQLENNKKKNTSKNGGVFFICLFFEIYDKIFLKIIKRDILFI